ncbi:MAG: hypothetical protein KGJ66_02795 [Alphaproteobacteria bacterium]|nr:hypothetical protein [Alphaproteobacteria bacterium]
MTDEPADKTLWAYDAHEAVGVFHDPAALEKAVDELEINGFDRSAISVLTTSAHARERTERFYRTVADIEDRADVPRQGFASSDSRTVGKTAAVGIPLYIGAVVGAFAVVATGGALALAFEAAIAGGAVGAGLGALLAAAVARHHAAWVQEQLTKGGIVLWVNTPSAEAEKRAVTVLERLGARNVRVHHIPREWNIKEIPFAAVQPDPFLESLWRRLFGAMAARLGVDPTWDGSRIRRGMQHICAVCSEQRRCQQWLAAGSTEGYEEFCPNAEYWHALKERIRPAAILH